MDEDSMYNIEAEDRAIRAAREADRQKELLEDEDSVPLPLESTPITDAFLTEEQDEN